MGHIHPPFLMSTVHSDSTLNFDFDGSLPEQMPSSDPHLVNILTCARKSAIETQITTMVQLDRKADSGVIYPSDQEPVARGQKWHPSGKSKIYLNILNVYLSCLLPITAVCK